MTLVHKGNIMKFTEGAFRDWGYEVAKAEFRDQIVTEEDVWATRRQAARRASSSSRIASPTACSSRFSPARQTTSVFATPNLNGDYLSDACAAQVGGLGMAPGANMRRRHRVLRGHARHGARSTRATGHDQPRLA